MIINLLLSGSNGIDSELAISHGEKCTTHSGFGGLHRWSPSASDGEHTSDPASPYYYEQENKVNISIIVHDFLGTE